MKQALRGGQLAHLSLLRRYPLVGLLENLPTLWEIVKVFRIEGFMSPNLCENLGERRLNL